MNQPDEWRSWCSWSSFALRCADLARSRRFYELLGLEFAEEPHGAGPLHLATDLGGTVLDLYPARDVGERVNLATIGLTLADLVAMQERLRTAGVPIEWSADGEGIMTTDPDGRRIRITAPSSP